jgi:catechol 2,3-dioxygenase-like lactoylglutathione lyase family enzyme
MKMHLHLATRDLDASVAFYRTLLLAEPVKHYRDYALFLTDDPGLELALDLDLAPTVTASEAAHYGLVVNNPEAVNATVERLRAAGLSSTSKPTKHAATRNRTKCGRPILTGAAGKPTSCSRRLQNATDAL